jgi:hypothetical protein
MPRRQKPKTERLFPDAGRPSLPSISAAAVLSFLKETRGLTTWTARDAANSLKISAAEAKKAIAILELQGYVKSAGANEWMTTISGEEVSGSKSPRYARESVEQELAAFSKRITEVNRDSAARYKVVEAVAFGDFMSDRPRVQSADIGVRLARRKSVDVNSNSATERKAQRAFLKQLHGRTSLIHVMAFESWMSLRSQRKLE